jgi:putative ABC transport system permease protein
VRSLAGWAPALRIARREARRAKGRSALVIALIGLPVLAAAFAAVTYDMFTLTVEERLVRALGAADAQVQWVHDGPIRQADIEGTGLFDSGPTNAEPPPDAATADVLALLPPGSTVTPRGQGEVRLHTATGIGQLDWQAVDLTNPITRGIAAVTSGRAPATADEVAVTAPAADRLGVARGERVRLADSDGGSYSVVGIVEFPGDPNQPSWRETAGLDDPVVLFHPDGQPAGGSGTRWLVDTPGPVEWEHVQALNQHGVLVYSRAVAHDPPAGLAGARGSLVDYGSTLETNVIAGGLAGLEIVLLAGPAFAVGARRRQRELALVATGGGTPAQLRRIVLADGVVLGALAAAAGLALGVAAALAARPLVEQHLIGARAGGYRVFAEALAAIAVLAIGTGVLAALVPAFTAARTQVVDALAGRRGATRSRPRWLVLGLAMVGLGTATAGLGAWRISAEVMLAGLVLGQLGLALCTPTLIGLAARLGSRLPLAPRIALRDTARNRAAAAPAVSAVMAAVTGSVAAGMLLLAVDYQRWGDYGSVDYAYGTAGVDLPPQVDAAAVEQAVRATLPVAGVHHQLVPGCPADVDPDEVDSYECWLVTGVPQERRCPYWEAYHGGLLSEADQRAAARDSRCDSDHPPYGHSLAVDDGTILPALVDADPAELATAAQVLRDGGAVVTDEHYLAEDGTVTVGSLALQSGQLDGSRLVTVPGHLIAGAPARQGAIVPPAVVRAAGLDLRPTNLLFTTTRMPTQAEEDAFTAAVSGFGTFGWVQRDPAPDPIDATLLLLAGAAGVVALGAAGIATGLAATDRRPDLATLGAVGASPRVRRTLSLSQSGVIAGLGTGLGVLAGIGGAIAVLFGLNQQYADSWPAPEPYPITVPWPNLLVLLAVPVVAMLGAGLLTRSRLPIERRFT